MFAAIRRASSHGRASQPSHEEDRQLRRLITGRYRNVGTTR
jgi:hypothetical protein